MSPAPPGQPPGYPPQQSWPHAHGAPPHAYGQPPPGYGHPASQDSTEQIAGLIVPVNVKNGKAVAAGWLGILSFCLGPLFGIPAMILGVLALKTPELGGGGRAWTGIILGGLSTFGFLVWVVFALVIRA